MERQHVKSCIRDDIVQKRKQAMIGKMEKPVRQPMVPKETIDKVADMLLYYPDDLPLYAKSGCKRVSQKVDLVFDDMMT